MKFRLGANYAYDYVLQTPSCDVIAIRICNSKSSESCFETRAWVVKIFTPSEKNGDSNINSFAKQHT